jgi:hypothetical protein
MPPGKPVAGPAGGEKITCIISKHNHADLDATVQGSRRKRKKTPLPSPFHKGGKRGILLFTVYCLLSAVI